MSKGCREQYQIVCLCVRSSFPSGSTEHAVATVCLPATQQLAADLGAPVVDLFTPFAGKPDAFPDADHLDNPATDVMTAAVAEQVRALAESAKL